MTVFIIDSSNNNFSFINNCYNVYNSSSNSIINWNSNYSSIDGSEDHIHLYEEGDYNNSNKEELITVNSE